MIFFRTGPERYDKNRFSKGPNTSQKLKFVLQRTSSSLSIDGGRILKVIRNLIDELEDNFWKAGLSFCALWLRMPKITDKNFLFQPQTTHKMKIQCSKSCLQVHQLMNFEGNQDFIPGALPHGHIDRSLGAPISSVFPPNIINIPREQNYHWYLWACKVSAPLD